MADLAGALLTLRTYNVPKHGDEPGHALSLTLLDPLFPGKGIANELAVLAMYSYLTQTRKATLLQKAHDLVRDQHKNKCASGRSSKAAAPRKDRKKSKRVTSNSSEEEEEDSPPAKKRKTSGGKQLGYTGHLIQPVAPEVKDDNIDLTILNSQGNK
jgi:hypothetical protein